MMFLCLGTAYICYYWDFEFGLGMSGKDTGKGRLERALKNVYAFWRTLDSSLTARES